MRTFEGRCHCGRLTLEFTTDRDPHSFVPREDGCGFCQCHRALAIADPDGSLCVYVPADPPKPYHFGLNITDFHVCDRCGIFVAATWRDGDEMRGVINMPVLDDRILFDAAPVAVSFDGEDVQAREARRRVAWTPARIVTAEDK
jgi:hypothetical protein